MARCEFQYVKFDILIGIVPWHLLLSIMSAELQRIEFLIHTLRMWQTFLCLISVSWCICVSAHFHNENKVKCFFFHSLTPAVSHCNCTFCEVHASRVCTVQFVMVKIVGYIQFPSNFRYKFSIIVHSRHHFVGNHIHFLPKIIGRYCGLHRAFRSHGQGDNTIMNGRFCTARMYSVSHDLANNTHCCCLPQVFLRWYNILVRFVYVLLWLIWYLKYVLTRFVSCVSIMKLWTCFSALVNSNLRDTTATSRAVQPAPWNLHNHYYFFILFDCLINVRQRSGIPWGGTDEILLNCKGTSTTTSIYIFLYYKTFNIQIKNEDNIVDCIA